MGQCANCNYPGISEAHYCHNCGAKIQFERLSVFVLMKEALASFFNLEQGLLKTIKDLTFQPHLVSLGFIQGLRKRYVSPSRYMVVVLAFYGLYLLFLSYFREDSYYFHEEFIYGFHQYKKEQLNSITDIEIKATLRRIRLFAIPMLVSIIPVLSLIAKGVFRKAKFNFTEHLVIISYWFWHCVLVILPLAMLSICLAIATENEQLNDTLALFMLGIVLFLTYRKLILSYALTGWRRALLPFLFIFSTLLSMAIYFTAISFALI